MRIAHGAQRRTKERNTFVKAVASFFRRARIGGPPIVDLCMSEEDKQRKAILLF